MKQWFLLAGAITTEVAATLSLKAALNHPSWYIVVAAGYIGAFVFLTFCLREGMQIGVAYGIWGASGVVLAAAVGHSQDKSAEGRVTGGEVLEVSAGQQGRADGQAGRAAVPVRGGHECS